MYSWISSHMCDISMYQCIYVSTDYIRNMYSCRRFSNASTSESVDPVPKHKHWGKHSFTFTLSREVANDRRDWNAPTRCGMYQGKEESGIRFPRWPFSVSSSLQNKPKKTLTLYQNWDCGKKMLQQKTVKLHLFSFFMVSYLCIKLQSNPKSLCEDSFRTQLKTRESLCTSSKSNASSINGNYATATSFTLLPSAAAITNIDQKVS
jgi:hypothetical protein